ncbi:hypothetical protein BX600DRAFT_549311 [Xylariales sp. PMI_506]|nr:hypothetical protein BX600DRAFT_549311 [Xylariales sp. PMI_506]
MVLRHRRSSNPNHSPRKLAFNAARRQFQEPSELHSIDHIETQVGRGGGYGCFSSQINEVAPTEPPGESVIRTRVEARLFTHFARHLSSWFDICDEQSHFGTAIPRRALTTPLLAYSILAFSSRQLSLVSAAEDVDPASYYCQALSILIDHFNGPFEALDENVLVAIMVLRSYEEMAGRPASTTIQQSLMAESNIDMDAGTHLAGVTRLLNSVSNLVGKGGLAEAASWTVLRQDMYFSLTKSQPLHIDLDSYAQSRSFVDDSPESITNRIVYHCARIQAYAFGTDKTPDPMRWSQLQADVEDWYNTKPWQFRPMWTQTSGGGSGDGTGDGAENDSVFPTAWMHNPVYVLAYQHYYLSQILLAIFDPTIWEQGLDSFRKRQLADEKVRLNLRFIVGLSISHPSIVTARFLASHTLQACGTCLTSRKEQEEALAVLADFEKRFGWGQKSVAEKLIAAWIEQS